jgi:hypothetical protein
LKEEINLQRRLSCEARNLRNLSKKELPGLRNKILRRASSEALSGSARLTLRIGKQVEKLVDILKPTVVITTHEGHSWERIVFASARMAFPKVKCIGYQHAAIFQRQHAIRRSLAAIYNPDHIMTVGPTAKRQLQSASELNAIPISVLGTNRSFDMQKSSGEIKVSRSACLILPEGFTSESQLLFKFTLACAKALPELVFIFRMHPITTYKNLISKNTKQSEIPKNLIFSEQTLKEDILRSRWCLYRGTTAIITAVSSGVRPLYLRMPKEFSIDPLYELNEWRVDITTIADFIKMVRDDLSDDSAKMTIGSEAAQIYCSNYFVPTRSNILESFLVK